MNSIRGTYLLYVMSTLAMTLAFPTQPSTVSNLTVQIVPNITEEIVSNLTEDIVSKLTKDVTRESESLMDKCEKYIYQLKKSFTLFERTRSRAIQTMPTLPNYCEDSTLPSIVRKTKFLRRAEFNLTLLYTVGEKLSRRRILRLAEFDAVIGNAKRLRKVIENLRSFINDTLSSDESLLEREQEQADSELYNAALRELQGQVFPTDRKITNKWVFIILTHMKNQMSSLIHRLSSSN